MQRLFIQPLYLASFCLLIATAAVAQDDASKKASDVPAAAKDSKTAPESSAAEAPAAKAAADPEAAAAAFAAKLDEWKALLSEMRMVRTEYDEAEEGELAPILKRWNELLARGETLIGDLRQTGAVAFAAAPNEDRELTRFLVKILADDFSRDSYEDAAMLSQSLLDNGYDNVEVFNQGAVAAFNTNNYDKAKHYLEEAKSRGNLTDPAKQVSELLADYRGYWEAENAIRQKEAEADDLPRVKITTNKGEMVVELFENEAPNTVGNFISLIEKEFYNGLTFHRVLPSFMAQGGCPQGTGSGGPGYEIYCECHQENYRKHFRGTLSMAHAGRDSGGSQFFITFVPTPHLNGRHTGFGRVIKGFDVLAKINRTEQSGDEKPVLDKILTMEVIRKRDHEYKPDKVQ